MEYDEQVSARLHMSLDEIIGQEQQDGASQVKKRRARGAVPGPSSPPPATTTGSPSRPQALTAMDSVNRYSAPVPPPVGGPRCFPSRPSPSARPLPLLMRGPPGRLPGSPPFGIGPRPPFHMLHGHPRMNPSWPRPRHLGGDYLMSPNAVQPPPPPMSAGPDLRCGPPRAFLFPPRPGAGGEMAYSPRRPLVGPYSVPRPMQPGPPRPGWKRSRFSDDVQGQNGDHSSHHPLGYPPAVPALASDPTARAGEPNECLPNQMPYGYGPRGLHPVCENRHAGEYFDPAYSRDSGMDCGHVYSVSAGETLAHTGHRGPRGPPESTRNRQGPPDQCTSLNDFPRQNSRGVPVRGANSAVGVTAGGASLADRREFTVIVSNVSTKSIK